MLPGFFSDLDSLGPERVVALTFRADTSIQPGALAGMYAGIGLIAIPCYWLFSLALCLVCDVTTDLHRGSDFGQRLRAVLCLNVLWLLQMPMFPAVASSGILGVCVLSVVSYFYGASPKRGMIS